MERGGASCALPPTLYVTSKVFLFNFLTSRTGSNFHWPMFNLVKLDSSYVIFSSPTQYELNIKIVTYHCIVLVLHRSPG